MREMMKRCLSIRHLIHLNERLRAIAQGVNDWLRVDVGFKRACDVAVISMFRERLRVQVGLVRRF